MLELSFLHCGRFSNLGEVVARRPRLPLGYRGEGLPRPVRRSPQGVGGRGFWQL